MLSTLRSVSPFISRSFRHNSIFFRINNIKRHDLQYGEVFYGSIDPFSTSSHAPLHNSENRKMRFGTSGRGQDELNEETEFGTIAREHDVKVFKLPAEYRIPEDKDDEQPYRPRSTNSPVWYFLQCKRLAKQNKVVECVNFLEEKMLKQDRVFPEEQNFTVVIGALGRIGYARKAFKLYYQMKDRALPPTLATYTALFNAVASSPYRRDIEKAIGLYEELHKKRIRLNRITYNAAIKAFGRHGNMEQMMGMFKESITKGFEPNSNTFNMILWSIAKEKDVGSLHAIEVWRQMIMLDVKPDGRSIIYLLKALKSCGIGDLETANRKLIQEIPDPDDFKDFFRRHTRNVYWLKGQKSMGKNLNENEKLPPTPEMMTIEPGYAQLDANKSQEGGHPGCDNGASSSDDASSFKDEFERIKTDKDSIESPSILVESNNSALKEEIILDNSVASFGIRSPRDVPNLLTLPFDKPNSSPVQIGECQRPWQRLQLIGGYRYILDILKKYDIKPTVMLLSNLVQLMEPDIEAENEIMKFAEESKIPLDVDFYNMVLHKRAKKLRHRELKDVLRRMAERGLSPNYRTWCVIALSCTVEKHGVSVINSVKNTKVELDNVFFNSLICGALKNNKATRISGYPDIGGYAYSFLSRIVYEMQLHKVKADNTTIRLLEEASEWPQGYERWHLADVKFEKKVFNFRKIYKEWLDVVEMAEERKRHFQEFKKPE